jgi:hypothetical protein
MVIHLAALTDDDVGDDDESNASSGSHVGENNFEKWFLKENEK